MFVKNSGVNIFRSAASWRRGLPRLLNPSILLSPHMCLVTVALKYNYCIPLWAGTVVIGFVFNVLVQVGFCCQLQATNVTYYVICSFLIVNIYYFGNYWDGWVSISFSPEWDFLQMLLVGVCDDENCMMKISLWLQFFVTK